jgi:gluconokinase
MKSEQECIISVEIGTNAVRIVAFNFLGKELASMKGAYPTFHTQADFSEQDPEQIFITMLYVLKNLLTEHVHTKGLAVSRLVFSSSMHSLLSVDKHGSPIGNAITWADNRGKQEAMELKESKIGKKIYDSTGTPIHPMSPLVKISWTRHHAKDRFDQASKFLSLKSYIIFQLTGDYVIDYSLASAMGLLNIHTLEWDDNALGYAGISANKLASLVPVFHSNFKIKKEYQKLLGLGSRTKIITGSSDGCLATLGSGVLGNNKAIISIEDSGAVRMEGKKVIKDPKQRFFNYILTEGHYVSGGPTNNGNLVFEWFAKQFGNFNRPYDMDMTMENLLHEAARVQAGSNGLLFLPYLLGERAPIWNPSARGVYFGINIKHEKQHMLRATLEGILYQIYYIGKTLQEHKKFDSLVVHGSFATIPFITQIIADMFNMNVSSKTSSDRLAFGSFLLAATELGIYKNLEESVQAVQLPDEFTPRKSEHETYMKFFPLFERLSTKLQDEFIEISNLQ